MKTFVSGATITKVGPLTAKLRWPVVVRALRTPAVQTCEDWRNGITTARSGHELSCSILYWLEALQISDVNKDWTCKDQDKDTDLKFGP